MEHREPLADMYLEHCEELFSVFQEPSIASQELVLPVWLEQVDSMQPLACECVRA
ncbi:hypothetical protein MKX62_15035 [Sporosarcina sp. FSL K6-5500]